MLETVHARTVLFIHLEQMQIQILEQRTGLRLGMEIHEYSVSPIISVTEQVPGKNAARLQRRENVRPDVCEMLGMTER
ncbi:hypothetical protein D3C72_1377390 [compost metagenome]